MRIISLHWDSDLKPMQRRFTITCITKKDALNTRITKGAFKRHDPK